MNQITREDVKIPFSASDQLLIGIIVGRRKKRNYGKPGTGRFLRKSCRDSRDWSFSSVKVQPELVEGRTSSVDC